MASGPRHEGSLLAMLHSHDGKARGRDHRDARGIGPLRELQQGAAGRCNQFASCRNGWTALAPSNLAKPWAATVAEQSRAEQNTENVEREQAAALLAPRSHPTSH